MSGMYWYAVAASDNVAGLKNKGFCITDEGEILYNEQYEYALARMYTNDGHGIVDVETSNFFFDKDASDRITINAEDPMTTPVLSYKLRMTDQYPDAEWFYFAADKSEEILEDGVAHPLYKADGTLATKTDYADCEFEALNPMPSEFFGMYGRFTTATFSFATYQSTADVLHVEFTGLHQEEDEYCFADRLRVVVTASPAPSIPFGGVLTSTSDSVIRVPVEQAGGVVEEYSPAPALPAVSLSGDFGEDNWLYASLDGSNEYVSSGGSIMVGIEVSGRPYPVSYDTSKQYAVIRWGTFQSSQGSGHTEYAIVNNSGQIYAKNVTSGDLYLYAMRVAVCSDSSATVITVYNSSNNPYNAFKYTSDGTDYYYVLDGTQTDWTDNLSSIGYRTAIFPLDLIVGMNIDNSTGNLIAVTFDYPLEENYWNTRVKSAEDKELLQNLGLWVDYPEFLYGSVLNTSSYRYEIIEIYTGVGEGVAPFDLSDFYIPDYQKLSLGCTGSYSTPVKSWKLRITPIPPVPALPTVTALYLNPSHTAVEVIDTGLFGAGYTLYYENGDTYSESTIPLLGAAFGQNVQWSPSDVSNRFELVLRNNKVVLDGKGAYSSYVQRIEICADTGVTIIIVYDSSNNPYNAFKYTSDGTDYYYVLDGTQTDWTDDLASIGYSDQLLIHGWMKADKSSVTLNAGSWANWGLFNDSGSVLYVDTSKTYTLHSPKSGTMKINKSVSGELYYEGTPSETIIVSDVIISVS